GRLLVVAVTGVGGLPVVGADLLEGDVRRVRHAAVAGQVDRRRLRVDLTRAAGGRLGRARAVAVHGVGHGARRGAVRPRQAGRVVHRAADVDRILRDRRSDHPPRSTLFPYTTLFRSGRLLVVAVTGVGGLPVVGADLL